MKTLLFIVRNVLLQRSTYRVNLLYMIAQAVFYLLIQIAIWVALYAGQREVAGTTLDEMITYVILAQLVGIVAGVYLSGDLEGRVKSGDIAVDLLKPLDLRMLLIFENVGWAVFSLLFRGIPMLAVALIFFTVIPPASAIHLAYFIVSLFGAYLVSAMIEFVKSTVVFWQLDGALLGGGLDEVLIKPVDSFAYYLTRGISVQYSAHIALATFFMVFSLVKLAIPIDVPAVARLAGILIGASLIQASITIIVACTAFWTRQAGHLVGFVIQNLREFIRYPISIYPRFVQIILTVVVPYGFVNFYPAYRFFGKSDGAAFIAPLPIVTLVLGTSMALLSYLVWSRGVRRYESVGA